MLLSQDLRLAHQMADTASAVALTYYGHPVDTQSKPDGSLVSTADLDTEDALLKLLATHRPQDSVLTEETGLHPGMPNRRWILDPIDGTTSFLTGGQAWGTHVALEVDGILAVALFTRPTQRRRWWAARGQGAFAGFEADPLGTARRLKVSVTATVAAARIGALVEPGSPAAAELAARAHLVTDEVSVIGALLEGRLDAVLDEGGRIWDQAPGALLVTEAGGLFRDAQGGQRLDLGWSLYSNHQLHEELMTLLHAYLPTPQFDEGGDSC